MKRKEEAFLIELGLMRILVDAMDKAKPIKKKKKGRWTKNQHKKFADTMSKKFNKKQK